MRHYLKESILGPLFKLFEATLELIVPLIIAAIIDNGINKSDIPYVIRMCLLLVLLGAVGLAFSVTAQYFAAKASVGFVTKVKGALFSHMQKLSYSDVDNIGTSTLITRITTDTSRVQSGMNLALRLLLRSPFVVFGAMIMAFTIDVKSALTFAVVIPALSVVIFGIMLISMPLYKKVQGGVDGILLSTKENLSGIRVVRAFGKEEHELKSFREKNDRLTEIQKYVGRISALMNPLTYVLINLAIVFLIYIGALQVNVGNLTSGQVIALYNYMSQILVELIKLANLIITISKALASADRIADVLDVAPSMEYGTRERIEASDIAIEFHEVALKYNDSSDNAIENLSFKIYKGETVGVIGGTGSGKSSLVNLIPRFYDATEGEVSVFGNNVKDYTEKALKNVIGIVPQKAVLFRGSIRDNLLWGDKDADDVTLMQALEIAQATAVVEDKGGLDAKIEQGGRNLSGGQRQRLTIARALVKKPDILILDDSSSALDYATEASLRRALKESTTDSTVIIVSQRAASIMHADRIIVLDDGRVVGEGKHEQLLAECPVYKEIYDSQFKKEVTENV